MYCFWQNTPTYLPTYLNTPTYLPTWTLPLPAYNTWSNGQAEVAIRSMKQLLTDKISSTEETDTEAFTLYNSATPKQQRFKELN